MRRSFHSSYLRGSREETYDYAFEEEKELARQEAIAAERRKEAKKHKTGARAGMILAPLSMGYGLYARDVPTFFVGLALVLILLQPYAEAYLRHGRFVAKVFRTLAITLFLGALVLLFF